MTEPRFALKYEGGDADQHTMEMRALALSMLGAEKIASDGLIILMHKRLPKRGERSFIILKAGEPGPGSLVLWGLWESARGLLQLGAPLATELAGYFLEEWWKAVIAKFSGRPDLAEISIKAMVDMNDAHLAARDAADDRRHQESMEMLRILRAGVAGQQRAAEQFVTPIGQSVETVTVFPVPSRRVLITAVEADAIRETAKVTWGPLEQLTLRTDGFRFHTSGLSIENPERDGFLMARVRDPRFDEPENSYTEAAQRRSEIVVLGRKGYKDEALTAIDIVDFVRENLT